MSTGKVRGFEQVECFFAFPPQLAPFRFYCHDLTMFTQLPFCGLLPSFYSLPTHCLYTQSFSYSLYNLFRPDPPPAHPSPSIHSPCPLQQDPLRKAHRVD